MRVRLRRQGQAEVAAARQPFGEAHGILRMVGKQRVGEGDDLRRDRAPPCSAMPRRSGPSAARSPRRARRARADSPRSCADWRAAGPAWGSKPSLTAASTRQSSHISGPHPRLAGRRRRTSSAGRAASRSRARSCCGCRRVLAQAMQAKGSSSFTTRRGAAQASKSTPRLQRRSRSPGRSSAQSPHWTQRLSSKASNGRSALSDSAWVGQAPTQARQSVQSSVRKFEPAERRAGRERDARRRARARPRASR